MMKTSLVENKLLFALGVAFAVYWSASWLVPDPFTSITTNILLFSAGLATLWRYSPSFYPILFKRVRMTDPGAEGSHLAVLGVIFLAFGSCYIGGYGLIWNWMNNPDSWIQTPFSAFGRAAQALGFIFMWRSPSVARPPSKYDSAVWIFILCLIMALAGFLVGTRFAYWRIFGPY